MVTFIFDLDDTLYQVNKPFEKACELSFGELLKDVDINELLKSRNHYSNEVFEASANGSMSMEDMYCYRMQKALEDFSIEISRKQALDFQKTFTKCQNEITLSELFKENLSNYKEQGINLGVISNGPSGHQWDKINSLGLLEYIPKDCIVISGELGITKPSKEIFDYALKKMNADKEKTYYIGDSYKTDIVGAANAGIKTIWLNRNNQDYQDIIPDHQVRNEEELFILLEKLYEE